VKARLLFREAGGCTAEKMFEFLRADRRQSGARRTLIVIMTRIGPNPPRRGAALTGRSHVQEYTAGTVVCAGNSVLDHRDEWTALRKRGRVQRRERRTTIRLSLKCLTPHLCFPSSPGICVCQVTRC